MILGCLSAKPVLWLVCAFNKERNSWNNGKSGAKLVLTSSTTAGLQIHKFDHSWTANPCDWLLCRCAALPLVGCPHSIVYLHLPVVEGLIFCISATPHLGTSFPLFHDQESSLVHCTSCRCLGCCRMCARQCWLETVNFGG